MVRVTFEVNQGQLFDQLAAMNGDCTAVGIRLVQALMPADNRFLEAVGLAMYGIEIVEIIETGE